MHTARLLADSIETPIRLENLFDNGVCIIYNFAMKRHGLKIIAKIIRLRKAGYSLAEISHITSISKNTIYHWVKTVELTQKQKARLHKKEIL